MRRFQGLDFSRNATRPTLSCLFSFFFLRQSSIQDLKVPLSNMEDGTLNPNFKVPFSNFLSSNFEVWVFHFPLLSPLLHPAPPLLPPPHAHTHAHAVFRVSFYRLFFPIKFGTRLRSSKFEVRTWNQDFKVPFRSSNFQLGTKTSKFHYPISKIFW